MAALKIGSTVSRLAVQCITLVSCLAVCVPPAGRSRMWHPASWLAFCCSVGWIDSSTRRKLNFVFSYSPSFFIISSPTPPQLSPLRKKGLLLFLPPFFLLLSVWSPDCSSVPSILRLSGPIQSCLPLASLSTKLRNEERGEKGQKKKKKGRRRRWEMRMGRSRGGERRWEWREGSGFVTLLMLHAVRDLPTCCSIHIPSQLEAFITGWD